MRSTMIKLGQHLFRYRAVIAVPFFIMLVLVSRLSSAVFIPCVLMLVGLGMRLWAAGYIGTRGRTRYFLTDYRIISGPYRICRHPLYIGNFLLVLGVVLLFKPPPWYALVVFSSFVGIYSLIAYSESSYLRDRPLRRATFRSANLAGEVSTMVVVLMILALYIVLRSFQ